MAITAQIHEAQGALDTANLQLAAARAHAEVGDAAEACQHLALVLAALETAAHAVTITARSTAALKQQALDDATHARYGTAKPSCAAAEDLKANEALPNYDLSRPLQERRP